MNQSPSQGFLIHVWEADRYQWGNGTNIGRITYTHDHNSASNPLNTRLRAIRYAIGSQWIRRWDPFISEVWIHLWLIWILGVIMRISEKYGVALRGLLCKKKISGAVCISCGYRSHIRWLSWRVILNYFTTKKSLQRNPVSPIRPSCPMSSVAAWSTAAAARGATARARHESPVISALQGIFWSPEFLCGFQLTLIFLSFRKRWREKGGTLFEFRHSIPAFPMDILEIYEMLSV